MATVSLHSPSLPVLYRARPRRGPKSSPTLHRVERACTVRSRVRRVGGECDECWTAALGPLGDVMVMVIPCVSGEVRINHVETAADATRVRPFADRRCNKMYDIELLLEQVVRESSE